MVFQDCCTDAEAKAAGAPLPLTEQEHDAQIIQDIPYMVLSIGRCVCIWHSVSYSKIVCVCALQHLSSSELLPAVETIWRTSKKNK